MAAESVPLHERTVLAEFRAPPVEASALKQLYPVALAVLVETEGVGCPLTDTN